ncbi:cytochrome b5-related protein-like [Plodia interpunctella]|uniref:cytochrome b5-related protein-like n=1 Tax=Plodia interpunctella TaxID=58824 RepID=UPI0023674258|nr:cytochrome b5-related protein-like [Plodia interpunctella]
MAPKGAEYLEIAHQRAVEKKTHVSFPQLKYPSLRDEGLRDPVQWLTGKAMDDGAEGLWRVHDSIYDLSEFVNKHPGGAEWLDLTKGTDITEAFESHHLSSSVDKMLQKYYVHPAKTPRNSPFTFKEDGFYKSLKRSVMEELKRVPKSVGSNTDKIIDGLFLTFLISSAITSWAKNYWIVTVAWLTASLTMAWVMVAAHNYIHRKTNWRMYLFSIGLWSYRDFRVSHALSHHLYPNTLMDLEISGFEPIVFWLPRRDTPSYGYFSFLFELIIFPFGFILNFLKRLALNFIRKDFYKRHYRWHEGLGLLPLVWMYIFSSHSFIDTFVLWLWVNCTASFIFFTIGTNAAHHHPDLFHDGDELREPTRDWGIHEVDAVVDRTDINGNLFKVMTFFGDHTLHHLFPTLDHEILPYLYPTFLAHVAKYKANFRLTKQLNLFIQQIKVTMKREPNTLSEDD